MRCPGQDTSTWKPGDIFEVSCPHCGQPIEFFKDDVTRTCRGCGHKATNPRLDFGCAAHCAYADQCRQDLPRDEGSAHDQLLKTRIAQAVTDYFESDTRRIKHAFRVAEHAAALLEHVPADRAVVMAAAYLHDIGIRQAEERYQSAAPRLQHELGPPVAQKILAGLGADARLIEEVCDIIGHHHSPGPQETQNFKVLYDADLLAFLEEEGPELGRREAILRDAFLTDGGRARAQLLFKA